ncbi:GtrA family protein [Neobacillus jeddahensis]|uniref:GtrA family protein n=1 Tax=Neobacillus jeddahensis TaxID=1461580 RepID=UPI00058F5734|nr:GtrA family protein [Neobacillus jeddahensis]
MENFLKFSLIGLVNTFITICSYFLLVKLGIHYISANIISYTIGLGNSYYWNKKWVFKFNGNHLTVMLKFITVNLFVLGINTLSLFFCVNKLEINQYFAQLIATTIGMSINFILNKKWTFDSKQQNRINSP